MLAQSASCLANTFAFSQRVALRAGEGEMLWACGPSDLPFQPLGPPRCPARRCPPVRLLGKASVRTLSSSPSRSACLMGRADAKKVPIYAGYGKSALNQRSVGRTGAARLLYSPPSQSKGRLPCRKRPLSCVIHAGIRTCSRYRCRSCGHGDGWCRRPCSQ